MKTITVTSLEKKVLESLAKGMYAELGFSDYGLPELREDTGLSSNVLRGVASSLIKKGLISIDDREGCWGINPKDTDMHIWYLTDETFGLVDEWVGQETWYHKKIVEKVILQEAS